MRRKANIGCLPRETRESVVAAWTLAVWAILVLAANYCVRADEFDFSGCDESSCEMACEEDCCPLWTTRVGIVALERGRAEGSVLISDAVTLAPLVNADNFAFGYEPGFDVSLIRHGQTSDFEARYLQNDAWNPRFWASTPNTTVQINGAIPTFIGVVGPVAMRGLYDSDLLSGEFNVRRSPSSTFTWLFGFRYLEVDEHLSFVFYEPLLVAPTAYDVITRNRLYGGQLGAEFTRWSSDRWEWGLGVKGGVFFNAAAQGSFIDTGVVLDTAYGAGNSTSVLGEGSVSVNYHVRPRLSLRATYSILAFSGLALSSDQVTVTDFIAGTGFDDNGNVFYHGGFLGLEYRL